MQRGTALVLSFAAAALATFTLWQSPLFSKTPRGSDAGTTVAEVNHAAVWDAQLPDLAGQTQALKQWQGKVVVLNFWAPWCPPCRKEIPGFIRQQDSLGVQGLQIVGVALDEAEKVQAYADETGINYPILLGEMQAVALGQAAGNRLGGLPYTAIFNRQGQVVATLVGELDEARLITLVKPLL